MTAINGAEIKIDRGRLRRGFSTSSAIVGANSRPANANAIEARRFNAGRLFRSGFKVARLSSLAGGAGIAPETLNKIRNNPGAYRPTPPAVFNHLPVPRPALFIRVAIQSVPSVTGST